MRLLSVVVTIITLMVGSLGLTSPPADPSKQRPVPKASSQAAEKLKRAFAAYSQGHYDQAIQLALDVYQQEGNVRARWWQSWVFRYAGKEGLPNPYNFDAIRKMWVEGKGNLAIGVRGARPVWILTLAYMEIGDYEEAVKWAKLIGGQILYDAQWLYNQHGGKVKQLDQPPPKQTWRPLPLKFREEDYFILVPLDEACKILGLSCTITTNPKMAGGKGIRIVKPDAPNIVYRLFLGRPMVERLENGKGQTETLAYAPYEEGGVVWVPFYWLAKQAGIRWWEVRDGKIYVAPKQGTK
jgi:hypothetical protein